jgi:RNA polymerase sigma-70 factor, ECF subfamily
VSSFPAARFPALPLSQQQEVDHACSKEHVAAIEEPSDDALISSIRGGNQDALTILFRRYARLVWGIGKRIVGDRGEADDVLQDVFLLVYRKASIFDRSKGTVRSLIVHMAYQRAITRRNYLARRHSAAPHEAQQEMERLAASTVRLYDESIEAHFGKDALRKALDDLSVDQRSTIQLYFFEGRTLAEIGEKLGQPVGNVKHHYYRGLDKLRKHLPKSRRDDHVARGVRVLRTDYSGID